MNQGDYMQVTVDGYLNDTGSPWTNVWTMYCVASTDTNSLQNIGSYIVPTFLETFYGPLEGTLSQYLGISDVSLREHGSLNSGYDWSGQYLAGSAAQQPYPIFVTMSVELVRDNFAFRNGRKAIPGLVAIHTGNNGKMLPASRAALNALVSGWADEWTVEAGAAEYTFVARIVHDPSNINVIPDTYSDVSSVSVRGFGTQNTRK